MWKLTEFVETRPTRQAWQSTVTIPGRAVWELEARIYRVDQNGPE